jgi:hypothetical protein
MREILDDTFNLQFPSHRFQLSIRIIAQQVTCGFQRLERSLLRSTEAFEVSRSLENSTRVVQNRLEEVELMKQFALASLVLLVLALAHQAAPAPVPDNTHEISAQVVSTDTENHMITYKADGEDEEATMPVMEKAQDKLKDLKTGDKVVLVCQDDEDGQHQGIVEIKPVKSPSSR